MWVRYARAHNQGKNTLNETFDTDSLTPNLVERENDSWFSRSLAKSSDAYFRFGNQDSKEDPECSTMSRSKHFKTVGTEKANQDWVYVLIRNLTSFKLNVDVKVNIFYQNDFMLIYSFSIYCVSF
jgi:hypothetical protein